MSVQILISALIILFEIHSIFVSGQVYRTEIVCSPSNVKLECAAGEVINIVSAYYGRRNGVTCPGGDMSNQHCYTPGAKHVISTICNNKPNCIVYAKNEVYGDPCVGITKYLEIQYICLKSDIKSLIVCGGNQLALTCESGYTITVVNANFGRYDSVTCPHTHMSNIYCTAAGSKEIIGNQCNNKEACAVAFQFMFGDPCYLTYKYLDIQYRCVKGESSSIPQQRPCCFTRTQNSTLMWDGMNWVNAEK